MHKIPRDISGMQLYQALDKFGYKIKRIAGSRIRLDLNFTGERHSITIPNHTPIKIGTLNNMLNDCTQYLHISKYDLIDQLF
jgi:predicted RNA binding protein YcfA (HicA-like mRNA interferase family)